VAQAGNAPVDAARFTAVPTVADHVVIILRDHGPCPDSFRMQPHLFVLSSSRSGPFNQMSASFWTPIWRARRDNPTLKVHIFLGKVFGPEDLAKERTILLSLAYVLCLISSAIACLW